MVNEEIFAGLKSAISHGFSIEEAMQSLINAGYNAQEVKEAAAYLSQPSPKPAQPAFSPLYQTPPNTQKSNQTSFVTILLIIGIAILSIAIVGIILFWKEISSFLS